MYLKCLAFICCMCFLFKKTEAQYKVDVDKQMNLAMQQYKLMLAAHPDTTQIPHSLNADGSLRDMPSDWWCSGFFGASLWYLYGYSKLPEFKKAANKWTMAVQKEQYNTTTHDLGFMIFYPFGNGFRLTGNKAYKNIMLQGAKSLSTRFDSARGVIKSWDDFKGYQFPVIIDNMMNLDYLFWAAKETGYKKYYDICIAHADATLKNHFRKDFSSYHVVCYDENGKAEARKTHQGYSDESAWARGQAWALYGYTSMYRETKDKKYLDQAVGVANFMLSHPNLPADMVPYWDFNAPNIPNEERDVSAAAIMGSGLLELSMYVFAGKSKEYFSAAEKILSSLSQAPYRCKLGESGNFLLKHSVGHKPGNIEVDVPLGYADYYYIEALLRYKKMHKRD